MRERPGITGIAPSDRLEAERAQGPGNRARKPRNQRDARNRASRVLAIDASERAKGGIIEAEPHADAEQQPRCRHRPNRGRRAEESEPASEHEIGDAQDLPAADTVDLAADTRTEQSGDHQRSGERREKPVAGNPEIMRNWISENGRQIVARSPSKRLRRAERQHDT